MGKTEKPEKKITQVKWPKYQKPKDENMGWTKNATDDKCDAIGSSACILTELSLLLILKKKA